MTIGGALSELNNLLKADDIPIYYKPSIKAVMDTVVLSNSENSNRWIPVERELPDIHDYCMKYLVTDCYGDIHISSFTETGGKSWWFHSDVTAWMSLPEPYKAESEVRNAT